MTKDERELLMLVSMAIKHEFSGTLTAKRIDELTKRIEKQRSDLERNTYPGI